MALTNLTLGVHFWKKSIHRNCFNNLKILPLDSLGGFHHTQLQNVSISHVFQAILCKGYVIDSDFTTDDEKGALMECLCNGWLHTDKLHVIGWPHEFGYLFSSFLHHWYVEWKLLDTIPEISFNTPNIMDLVVDIIHALSPLNKALDSASSQSAVSGMKLLLLLQCFEGLTGNLPLIWNAMGMSRFLHPLQTMGSGTTL